MCKDLKLTYIDNSYIIEDHPNYYAGDGIHVVSEFYPLWMNNMILKAGVMMTKKNSFRRCFGRIPCNGLR